MLGSHNTFTYLPTKGFLSSFTKRWSRCQEVNYIKQYTEGVRYFDVRIKFDKGKPVIVHNKTTYKNGDVKQLFAFLNLKKDSYVRMILDIRNKPKDADNQVKLFKALLSELQRLYIFVKIDDAIVYWNWEHLIKPTIKVTEKHASVVSNSEVFKTPKNYAEKHNKINRITYKNILDNKNEVLLIDFVNI